VKGAQLGQRFEGIRTAVLWCRMVIIGVIACFTMVITAVCGMS
jgi:hypothetical protein